MANRPKAKRDPALSADIRRMLKAGIPYQAALARALEAKTKRHRGEPVQSPVSPTSDAFLDPSLALSLDNLQILCHECNHGKGNWDMTDWREQTLTHNHG